MLLAERAGILRRLYRCHSRLLLVLRFVHLPSLPLVLSPGQVPLHLHLLLFRLTVHLGDYLPLDDLVGVRYRLGIGEHSLVLLADLSLLLQLVHPSLVVIGVFPPDLALPPLLLQKVASEARIRVNDDRLPV